MRNTFRLPTASLQKYPQSIKIHQLFWPSSLNTFTTSIQNYFHTHFSPYFTENIQKYGTNLKSCLSTIKLNEAEKNVSDSVGVGELVDTGIPVYIPVGAPVAPSWGGGISCFRSSFVSGHPFNKFWSRFFFSELPGQLEVDRDAQRRRLQLGQGGDEQQLRLLRRHVSWVCQHRQVPQTRHCVAPQSGPVALVHRVVYSCKAQVMFQVSCSVHVVWGHLDTAYSTQSSCCP